MTQTLTLLAFLAAPPVPGPLVEASPSYIGVQIARGKDEGTIYIQLVVKDAPAEKAGLKSGDVLVRINDVKPADLRATVAVIRSLTPGKKVKFLIRRDGKETSIDVTPVAVDG